MNHFTELTIRMLALMNPGTPHPGGGFLDSLRGPLLIFAIGLALALVSALVVLALYREGRGRSSRHSRSPQLTRAQGATSGEEGQRHKKRRRHKRRRRDHRKRNPTLSETGGQPSKSDAAAAEGEDAEQRQ